ncbi:MAG: hypothetical protein PHQ81_11695 [Methanofollis sp.]|nr:hypothetical protein [Methanofollis sp.]
MTRIPHTIGEGFYRTLISSLKIIETSIPAIEWIFVHVETSM